VRWGIDIVQLLQCPLIATLAGGAQRIVVSSTFRGGPVDVRADNYNCGEQVGSEQCQGAALGKAGGDAGLLKPRCEVLAEFDDVGAEAVDIKHDADAPNSCGYSMRLEGRWCVMNQPRPKDMVTAKPAINTPLTTAGHSNERAATSSPMSTGA
jgi:hypothetical protein